jgi:hypothetical protein
MDIFEREGGDSDRAQILQRSATKPEWSRQITNRETGPSEPGLISPPIIAE